MVTHGAVADFAIVAEGTGLRDRRDRAGEGPFQGHGRDRHAALLHAIPAPPHGSRGRAERHRPHRGGHRRLRDLGVRVPATADLSRVRTGPSSRRRASTRSAPATPTTSRARHRSASSSSTPGSCQGRTPSTSATNCAVCSPPPASRGPSSCSCTGRGSRRWAPNGWSRPSSVRTPRSSRRRRRSSASRSRACGATRTPSTSSASPRSATPRGRGPMPRGSRSRSRTSRMPPWFTLASRWISATRTDQPFTPLGAHPNRDIAGSTNGH